MTTGRLRAAALGLWAAVACRDPSPSPPPPPPAPRAILADAGATRDAAAAGPADSALPAARTGAPRVIVLDEPAISLPRQESFRLLDPGKGARQPLRYARAPGATTVLARTTLASRHLVAGDFSAPLALPEIRDGFSIEIPAESARPVLLRALDAEAAASSPDAEAYLAPWRSLLQGRRIAVELDDRGRLGAVRFADDPAGTRSARARDELIQRLLWLVVPLPDEPVGLAARWQVVTILRQAPAIAKQTATYTLIRRDRAGWKLHVEIQRVAEQQPITDPSLPPRTTAELVALFRRLAGDVEIDPELPWIAGGALAIESRLHARIQPAGQPASEQMFEDTGRVRFARCRPGAADPSAAPRSGPPLPACPGGISR